jgi:DNA replication protein DnaC
MLNNQTQDNLRTLKLIGMADALEQQLTQPATHEDLSFDERIALLVDREVTYRKNIKTNRLIKTAKLKQRALPEDIDYKHPRDLKKSQLADLLSCQWIQQHNNVLLTGLTGCSKTWLACALGMQACRQGLSVRYFRSARLFADLSIAHGDGRYLRLIKQLSKVDLLILDDWGLEKLNLVQRNDLLEIMEDRHATKSTLIAGQIPVNQRHKAIGDATLADAILDRLVHNAHKINLKGESMRKAKSILDEGDHS